MRCPRCQAKLLPVDGELFCLQCGESVHTQPVNDADLLTLEETTDPLLRRAITEASGGERQFSDVEAPVAGAAVVGPPGAVATPPGLAEAKSKRSFMSLRTILAPPRLPTVGGKLLSAGPVESVGLTVAEPGQLAGLEPELTELLQAPGRGRNPVAPSVWPARAEPLMVRVWIVGFAGLFAFIGLNMAISSYYSSRVLPGVRVQNLAVGGWTFDELHRQLPNALPRPKLAAVVDSRRYEIDVSGTGAVSVPTVEREVRQAGRNAALPIIGLIGSWFQAPVTPAYELQGDTVEKSVQHLAAVVERAPSNATPMMIGTTALALAEKPGVQLDKAAAAAAIRAAYGHATTANIGVAHPSPAVAAADLANDLAAAQAMIGQTVQLNIKKAHYTPAAEQIAGWVVFGGPGQGVSVNPAGVAAYVATIPGAFDRAGVVNSLVATLNGRQGGAVAPSKARANANPKPASTAGSLPRVSYNYCVDEASAAAGELTSELASTLVEGGWTLGGKIHFGLAKTGCNFVVRIGDAAALGRLDPACARQDSCRIHNDLAIMAESWANAPSSWKGDLGSYRAELINHIVGQWLGFDHPACGAPAAQTPVLSAATVTIAGCSPKWYPVPVELQDTKVLAGF